MGFCDALLQFVAIPFLELGWKLFLIDLVELKCFVVERIDQLTASLYGFAGLAVVAESIGHCGNGSTSRQCIFRMNFGLQFTVAIRNESGTDAFVKPA